MWIKVISQIHSSCVLSLVVLSFAFLKTVTIGIAHRLIILDICAKLFVNPTRGSKDIERTRNTVRQCLILDCDLDLEPTLVKHRHCTSSHHTWHVCKIICKSHQGFKNIERTRKRDGQTNGQTDRRTDRQTTELKTICHPISWGRHNNNKG